MSESGSIETASRRLTLALDALEAAVERRRDAEWGDAAVAGQMHAIGTDRARLAAELDQTVARARALEGASQEVVRRIDTAMATIRTVLATHERE